MERKDPTRVIEKVKRRGKGVGQIGRTRFDGATAVVSGWWGGFLSRRASFRAASPLPAPRGGIRFHLPKLFVGGISFLQMIVHTQYKFPVIPAGKDIDYSCFVGY